MKQEVVKLVKGKGWFFTLLFSCEVVTDSLGHHGLQSASLLCLWNFPGGQEHWSRLPFPSPGDPPDPRTEPTFPAFAGRFFTTKPPGKPSLYIRQSFSRMVGEGNDNPLQYSCLENPMGGAW